MIKFGKLGPSQKSLLALDFAGKLEIIQTEGFFPNTLGAITDYGLREIGKKLELNDWQVLGLSIATEGIMGGIGSRDGFIDGFGSGIGGGINRIVGTSLPNAILNNLINDQKWYENLGSTALTTYAYDLGQDFANSIQRSIDGWEMERELAEWKELEEESLTLDTEAVKKVLAEMEAQGLIDTSAMGPGALLVANPYFLAFAVAAGVVLRTNPQLRQEVTNFIKNLPSLIDKGTGAVIDYLNECSAPFKAIVIEKSINILLELNGSGTGSWKFYHDDEEVGIGTEDKRSQGNKQEKSDYNSYDYEIIRHYDKEGNYVSTVRKLTPEQKWERINNAFQRYLDRDIRVNKSNVTVLGKHPRYLEVAKEMNANALDMSPELWDAVKNDKDAALNLNKQFLDKVTARGDKIYLASDPYAELKGNSRTFYADELRYLKEKGYEISEDGTQMIKK